MKFKLYDNIKTFHKDIFEVLMGNEAQNLLILGNLITGFEGKETFGWRDTANWIMATVADGCQISLVALMTPPFGITLYAINNKINHDAVKILVEGLIANNIPVPGVVTEKSLAEAFTTAYCSAKSLTHHITMSQRIYELTTVNPNIPKIGRFRPAKEQDLSFLPYWIVDFHSNAGSTTQISDDIEQYKHHIDSGRLHMLEDISGTVVSMTKITREMVSAAGVALVYTPPYFRGHGYASSVVAQISQLWLDKGFTRCVLYTDLANPTSNSIYQKIGYVPICDSLEITFEEIGG